MVQRYFPAPFLQDGEAYLPARPLFDALEAKNYSQWAKVLGMVKVQIPTSIGSQAVDMLSTHAYFRAVFGSRSASSAQVQDEVVNVILNALAAAEREKAGRARRGPVGLAAVPVAQEAPEEAPAEPEEPPQAPFDVIPKPPPKPETPKLIMSKRVFDMLDTLDCYRSQVCGMGTALVEMRKAIDAIAEKYTMPEDAWLNCQLEQVMALMPDDALDTQFLQDDVWTFYALHVPDKPWLEASRLRSN